MNYSVTPFEVYKRYTAIKLHFTSEKYDYFVANGHIKVSTKSFENRRDAYQFKKFSKICTEETIDKFLASNFFHNRNLWIGDLLSSEAREVYLNFKKIEQSLTYIFVEDLDFLFAKLREGINVFSFRNKKSPELIKYAMINEIHIETFIILISIFPFIDNYEKHLNNNDVVWNDFKFTILKYQKFLTYDKEKFKKIFIEKIKKNFEV